MKIAALLNIHEDSPVVRDTLDSIMTYMTEDVLVISDGAAGYGARDIRGASILVGKEPPSLPVPTLGGFYHGCSRSPFRNMSLGLKSLRKLYSADWYCYMEYDCLVTSDEFKIDLERMARGGVWLAGNDLRCANYRMPLLEGIVGGLGECRVVLGCCVFLHRAFLDAMNKINFFDRFLHATNAFKDTVPGLDGQGAYDYAEVMYPTLAVHLGGRVEEFARFNDRLGWTGAAERYPMRFRPDIADEFPDSSIVHPLKDYDHPIRRYSRERRRRCKDSSIRYRSPPASCSTSRIPIC